MHVFETHVIALLDLLVKVGQTHAVFAFASQDWDSALGPDDLGVLGWWRRTGAPKLSSRFHWLLGDRIQAVDELPVVPLASGRSRVGQCVALTVPKRALRNEPYAFDYLVEASREAGRTWGSGVLVAVVQAARAQVFHVLEYVGGQL